MEPDVHPPAIGELPTLRQLNRATLGAALVAGMILILAVLPAEYGVDLTGAGRVFGLTPMGEAKRAAATASAAAAENGDILMDDASNAPAAPAGGAARDGEVRLTLQPGEGTEVKATMAAGDEFTYRWATNGPAIFFDQHGEEAGASSSDPLSYERGQSAGANGRFRAPFNGRHGWYWRNPTGSPVTVTVRVNGTFSRFEQLRTPVSPSSSAPTNNR
jgi:hypothetical protein